MTATSKGASRKRDEAFDMNELRKDTLVSVPSKGEHMYSICDCLSWRYLWIRFTLVCLINNPSDTWVSGRL